MLAVWTYRPRPGFYGSLDERARILFAACGVAAALVTLEPAVLAGVLAVGVAVLLLARITWREVRRFAFFAAWVIAMLVALTAWTREGTPAERAVLALGQTLRMLSLVTFTAVLPYTLDPTRYGSTFRRLGCPDRIAYAVELAFRFVPSFADRFQRTLEAQSARGLEVAKERLRLFERLRRLVPLVIPVVLDAVVAGEDMADAMDLRGFGTGPRTWPESGRFGAAEWGTLATGAALVAAAVVLG